MANISFGGGTDPSATFSYLNRQWLEDTEALSRRAASRSDEKKSAEDSDMYDKYKNGLISDDQWLAYIAKRVRESVGDEKEHQQWVETQREFETAIGDQRAEARFEAGEISIRGLIDHYSNRMDDVEEDSPEYRELQGRVFQLNDRLAEDDLWYGAQDITDRIATGKASLKDLLNFYKGKLGSLRRNSDLRRTVEREIRQIQSQITTAGFTGTGGGGGGSSSDGSGISGAEGVRIAVSGGLVDGNKYNLAPRDRWGVSLEAREFSGIIPGVSKTDAVEMFNADVEIYEYILKQFASGQDAVLPDGSYISYTPENAEQVWFNYADSSELKAKAQEYNNDPDGAMLTRLGRQDLRDNVMFPMNAVPVETLLNNLTADYRRDLLNADASDFGATAAIAARYGHRVQTIIRNSTSNPTSVARGVDDDPNLRDPKAEYERIGPETEGALLDAYNMFSAAASGDPDLIGQVGPLMERAGIPSREAERVYQNAFHQANIAAGTHSLAWTPEDGFVSVQAIDSPGKTWRPVYMDVGGTVAPVMVNFERQPIMDRAFYGVANPNGSAVNLDDWEGTGRLRAGLDKGLLIQAPTVEAWQAVMPTGQVLYYLPQLGPNGGYTTSLRSVLAAGGPEITQAEELGLMRYAHTHAVGTAYVGENPDAFVRLAQSGQIQVSDLYRFNQAGQPIPNETYSTLRAYKGNTKSQFARAFAWDDPEMDQRRMAEERNEFLARQDAAEADTIRQSLQSQIDKTKAVRRDDPFGDSATGQWMRGGPLGDIFGRRGPLSPEERGREAFGADNLSTIMGIASAVGVVFGGRAEGRAPSAAVTARAQSRLSKFAVPSAAPSAGVPRNTAATVLPRISLPVPTARTAAGYKDPRLVTRTTAPAYTAPVAPRTTSKTPVVQGSSRTPSLY